MADDTDDDLPEILIRRKRKHARAQAKSTARRKARNAPRRDDLARGAYYVLLLTMDEAEKQGEIERANRIRRRMLLMMEDALFDQSASAVAFDGHADTVFQDVEAWVGTGRFAKRREAEAGRPAADTK
ncbi:hypothetical protein G3T14_22830 [Methylobacterium sp. BTF04]|uniref:hypothetical protein n=1 Tax=Methylobacterium sp. BTF04 TaxID=2708300 RepID=UPI0013CF8DAF|nr:hypothetical protein [Methylobacterium sp. BTF04]NEU14892.1 hypothetical protein [Methylobacterium sp. BTF04]